jgi:putative transposase
MRRTYKYKAKITKATEVACNQWLSLCCRLYNAALEQKIDAYSRCRVSLSAWQQMKELPALKDAFPEYKTVVAQVLQDVINRLDKAFRGFFRRVKAGNAKAGFPRFKSFTRYDSFTLTQAGWKLEGRYLYVKGVGRFKLFLSRPIEGSIKTVTVCRMSTGKWFVCFSCDHVPARAFPEVTDAVGIDVGLKYFCKDSDDHTIENPRFLRQGSNLIRRRSRSLARKKKGSQNRKEARVLLAKAHEKVYNQRYDFAHKTANYYVSKYNEIYVEDLNIRNMVKNRHIAKSISDAAWGTFFDCLTYKAEEAGRQITKVNPRKTSQNCSQCGALVPKTLSVRVHYCPTCGVTLDRDLNAAINIKALGQRVQALTSTIAGVA